jgi:hypothetical protein
MTCAEFREIAALLAVGALDPPERSAAEAHLEEPTHEGCFEALRRAAESWDGVGRSLSPLRVDPRVWHGIVASVERRPRASAVRAFGGWAVAAALALALVFVQAARLKSERRAAEVTSAARSASAERDQCAKDLSQARGEAALQRDALALLAEPSTLVVSLAQQPGASITARALLNVAAQAGVVYAAGPAAPQGRDYELWVIRGEIKRAAGLLRTSASGGILARIDPALLAGGPPDALAVTNEPSGGAPRTAAGGAPQPTGDLILVGTFPHT